MDRFLKKLQKAIQCLRRRHPKPIWFLVVAHIVALGLALCVFALPHHVISQERKSLGVMSVRTAADTSVAASANEEIVPIASANEGIAPTASANEGIAQTASANEGIAQTVSANEEATQTASATSTGDFSERFSDKFISGDPVVTENSYVSENVNVTVRDYYIEGSGYKKGISYFVADFYVRDISCLKSAFAQGKYGKSITEKMYKVMVRENALLAINGDFYGMREGGVCLRNGQLYALGEVVRDIGVLYWDGRFEWYPCDAFDCEKCMNDGAYQAWNFGPALLDADGEPRTDLDEFYSDISDNQPRSAFGYYEPGHYCFICVDGRSDISRGMTLTQLANLSKELGLKQCYNLDGGRTSELAFYGKLVNAPGTGTRSCSDYICVTDYVSQ